MPGAGESVNRELKECSTQVSVKECSPQEFPDKVSVKRDAPRLELVYLLLAVALLGVLIEAVCICHLYSRHNISTADTPISSDTQKMERRKGEKDSFTSSPNDINEISPEKTPKAESKPVTKAESKPAAFLQINSATSGGNGVLGWRTNGFPMIMKGMDYKNNSLYIQQDGTYYIFSKISHLENCKFFKHIVMQCSGAYSYKPMELMQNSRFLCVPDSPQSSGGRGNSYLAGIFELREGDSVFVEVNNSSLVLHNTYENFFGAFMV